MDFTGYMIQGRLTDTDLRVTGSNKVSRAALATQAKYRDALEVPNEVAISLAEVSGLRLRRASMVTNGCLTVVTSGGDEVKLHFRRKQASDFDQLVQEIQQRTGVTAAE